MTTASSIPAKRADLAVIGGGPAGMMAAIAAAERGAAVVLLEPNERLGEEAEHSPGKGRCNLTNNCDEEEFLRSVPRNGRFLYSAYSQFTSADVMAFFEELGVPLKTERGNRVFPLSDKSSDVIRAFSRALKELGVSVCLGEEVESLSWEEGRMKGLILKKGGRFVAADRVVVATGGLSYPSTGSTGDGYRFARQTGHKVTKLNPALVPLEVRELSQVKALQGLSLRNVRIQVLLGKKVLYEDFGEILFTHFGVSGPVILSASSYVARELLKGELVLSVDLKPALDREQLDGRLVRDFQEMKNRQYKNALSRLLPSKMIPVIVERSGILPEKPVNEITREERKALADCLKDFRLTLTGLRDYREAIITQGGVSVGQVNPGTMESKLVEGLYFAGEVLDLDAMTGGYNLQIAFSTGYLAGMCAGQDKENKG